MTRRQPRVSRASKTAWIALAVGIALGLAAWWLAEPPEPGAFYDFELPADASPGELLRAEPFARDIPDDARGWRMLYTTTGFDGEVRLASAVVAVAGLADLVSLPLYWLLQAPAMARALRELGGQPYFWAKTTHGVSPTRRNAP